MASLLYHMGGTARWFTNLGASDIMCMARAPHQGSGPCEPSGWPRWAPWFPLAEATLECTLIQKLIFVLLKNRPPEVSLAAYNGRSGPF